MVTRQAPPKPKRGFLFFLPLLVAIVGTFVTTRVLIDGQFQIGASLDNVISIDDSPVVFWIGIALPGVTSIAMIIEFVRNEQKYRSVIRSYDKFLNTYRSEPNRESG